LELVNHALQNQQLDEQSLGFLKDNLLQYAQRVYGPSGAPDQIDTPSLQNKLTQTLTSVFMYSYKQNWQSFIDDFLALTSSSSNSTRDSPTGTILYLRILGSIHDEIADVLLSRSGQQQKRNNELKDLLRERDVPKVAASWLEILTYWEGKNDNILEMCLKVVGRWVNWVDISLVVNHNALSVLLRFVGRTSEAGNEDRVRDAAINCLTETVGKKMKTADKMEMILFINLGSIISQLSASPALSDFRHQPEYDTDLAEAVAKLVNTAVNDIVRALEDSSADPSVRARADGLLQEFVPLLLRFFSDEYDEVCSTVIPSLTDLFTLFRKAQPLPDAYRNMLPPILDAIMVKMRYDETADWDDDDDIADETEFQELRKRLQVLQKNVAAVDEDLYIEFLTTLVGKTFQAIEQRGAQTDWRDVDLALHEMYLFGELAVPNGGLYAKSQPSSVAAERLVAMMTKMIGSGKP
jgi:exportin-T